MMIKQSQITDLYPLSSLQSGLLFQSIYAPNSDAYIVQSVLRIKGELDAAALQNAWHEIVDSFPPLRTGFIWQDGEAPLQYVLDSITVPFEIEDWQSLKPSEKEESLRDYLKKDRETVFNLSKAPLFRISLIRCPEDHYYLIWTHHHIILDGWSVDIILKELFIAYEENRRGEKVHVIPSRPFRDFIAWLEKQDQTKAKIFWKDYLASLEEPTYISFKDIIQKDQEKDYLTSSVDFSADETALMKSFSQVHGLTLNTIIQGAVGIVLWHYSQQEEIALGVTVSGRNIDLPDVESMVGLFINTLPLKIAFNLEESALSFLRNLQRQTQELSQYTYTSLTEIQALREARGSLFNAVFIFENYLVEREPSKGNSSIDIEGVQHIEKTEYPLTIAVTCLDKMSLSISYQTEHFSKELIERMIDHIRVVIQEIINHPATAPQALSFLTLKEKQQILVEWNNTTHPFSNDKCIHELIEEQVTKTPNTPAVLYEDKILTYEQLNERSNQLAHHLRKLGVGADTLVAIVVERSVEMVIGILGILKAGGAYVPLDSTYPSERLHSILSSQIPILLTTSHLKNKISKYNGVTLTLDSQFESFTHERTSNPLRITSPHNLAYVIHTSGSTGQPKGVMVEHRNYMHYLHYVMTTHIHKGGAFFHSSPAFDINMTSIFAPLALGNFVRILPSHESIDFIGSVLEEESSFHFLELTPAHLKILKENDNKTIIQKQKGSLIVGGESLLKEDINYWLETASPDALIFNEYGPTEATVGCCAIKLDYPLPHGPIPIGRPISNIQMYILNDEMNPVSVGVTGEIYIGGAGLARGYLRRPDITAEKFIPNPFIQPQDIEKGTNLRLYRTGDLGRFLPDGNIEFLRRVDDQVKIRGFRVELEEIELTLNSHESVAQAVIVIQEDASQSKYLVAYIVPKISLLEALSPIESHVCAAGHTFSTFEGKIISGLIKDIKKYLASQLPDYMIPSSFIVMDRIPLTLNGKIDRKILPLPKSQQDRKEYIPPLTNLEKDLSNIWQNVLKIDNISVDDNFFDLGGHSLLATQIVFRILNKFKIAISLKEFFATPTIIELTKLIEKRLKQSTALAPTISPSGESESPLSFAQLRMWVIDQLIPQSPHYNIFLALLLKGNLNEKTLEMALAALANRHEILKTVFKVKEEQPYQFVNHHFNFFLPIIDLSLLSEKSLQERLRDCAQEEILMPFNLSNGPLFRAVLLKLNNNEHIFLLVLHHSVGDGWSIDIINKELPEIYNALIANREPELPLLPIQYTDFSSWQRNYLHTEGETYQKLISYWTMSLKEAPSLLELPTDHPRPAIQSFKGNHKRFKLSPEIIEKIKELSRDCKTTLFMTLLSAFYVLLHRYTGQEDIIVGSPIANRTREEVENLIGFFANTLALRAIIDPTMSFTDLLLQVKEKTLEAYDHQDLPFEALVSHLQIERSLSHEPLFQVMFVFQNSSDESTPTFKEIKVETIHFDYPVSKFDLTLTLSETDKGLEGSFEYATDLFKDFTIEWMVNHFQCLLESIVHQPYTPIHQLEMLMPEEKKKLLIDRNNTDKDYTEEKIIHALFEEQAENNPEDIAVTFKDEQLTYKELNQRANQLAYYLKEEGISSDTFVAIALERCPEMIIGMLGTLKAGGAYVPIDPAYPKERILYILNDARPKVLLTQSHIIGKLPEVDARVILLDKELEAFRKYLTENPPFSAQPYHLAYIIYTSGSTGAPKGVLIEHKSASNLLHWGNEVFSKEELQSVLCSTSICFDLSVFEIFLPLANGGEIILVEDVLEIIDSSHRERVTLLNTVPSAMLALLDESIFLSKSIIAVNLAGEPLKRSLVERLSKKHQIKKIYNLYGPSESTTYSTCFFVDPDSPREPTIGRPIANTKTYILDSALIPVPIGVIGELYIGGEGLARGYLNNPELTSEKFIENPFANGEEKAKGKNTRLYKTGDMCRWLEDGNIEYIGRKDNQIKIRGFRIELGEVESVLSGFEGIKESIVVVREYKKIDGESTGSKYLVAYYVANKPLNPEIMRSYLQSKLPDYMVPTFFIYLETIPITSNGKLDYKSLTDPFLTLKKSYVAPRNELEARVVEIWAEVIGIPKEYLGIQDDFFQIGGDSIISIQVVSRLREKLNLSIHVKDIFTYKTIERLYENVFNNQTRSEKGVETKREDGMLGGIVPLLPIQEWFFKNSFKLYNHWNQSFLIKTPELDIHQLKTSLKKLVEYHDGFRLRYEKSDKDESYIQYYDTQAPIEELKILDIRSLKAKEGTDQFEEKLQSILTDWQSSFNIENGPLYSIGYLYGYKDGSARIYFACHHLIIDTVSWRILSDNLKDLYFGNSLGSKGSSYRQWGETLKYHAKKYEEEREYWERVLSDYEEDKLKDLKTREDVLSSERINLTMEETRRLLEQCSQVYHTEINDLLLTALGRSLSKLTKNSVNHIILEGHGREEIDEEIDITRTLGWFTTLYPVRLETFEGLGESIKNIKETLRQIPNKGIGYGCLADYDKALPRISFNYLGQFKGVPEDDRLAWSIIDEPSGVAIHPTNHETNLIQINGYVINGAFQFNFSTKLTTEKATFFAEVFKESLQEIIKHCTHTKTAEHTISDFKEFDPYISFNSQKKLIGQMKLFFFPPGEGGAESYFGNIIPRLKDINLVAFNNYYNFLFDTNEYKEIKSLTYEKLAENYISYIKTLQPNGPYNLFGWSFGGVLAFEVARQLVKRGDEVKNVFMLDSYFNFEKAHIALKDQEKIADINLRYCPQDKAPIAGLNITMFKATKPFNGSKISKYYVQNTKSNHLNNFLSSDQNLSIIPLDSDHFSWVDEEREIEKICNKILSSL